MYWRYYRFIHEWFISRFNRVRRYYPMTGKVQVDEFTIGGKEKGKQGRSYNTKKKKIVGTIELTDDNKIKRFYSLPIKDYSSQSLQSIFKSNIDKEAEGETDGWRGYNKLKNAYTIKSSKSIPGITFNEINTVKFKILVEGNPHSH